MTYFANILSLSYPKSKNRVDFYDFLRGFAMMLVLIHHAGFPFSSYLLSFHMPLFFFLSGMVAGGRELPSFGQYIWNKFKRLMIPYFCFGFITVSIYYAVGLFSGEHYDLPNAMLGIVTGQYGYVPIVKSGIFWFLFVLFVADILLYPINKYFGKNVVVKLGGALLFIVLSYGTTHWFSLTLFTLDKAFMASVFIIMGGLLKPGVEYMKDLKFRWIEIFIILIGSACVVLSVTMNTESVLMYKNQYGEYGWFFFGAVMGIMAAILLGKYLFMLFKKKEGFVYRLVMWVGFNSLVLFPVHIILNEYFSNLYIFLGINNFLLRFPS